MSWRTRFFFARTAYVHGSFVMKELQQWTVQEADLWWSEVEDEDKQIADENRSEEMARNG
jgi:hypothetical protein